MRVTNLVATYCFKNRKWIRGEEKQAVMLDGFGMKRLGSLSTCFQSAVIGGRNRQLVREGLSTT